MELNEAIETLKNHGYLLESENYYTNTEVKEILNKLHNTSVIVSDMKRHYRLGASDNTCLGLIRKDDPNKWSFIVYDMEVNEVYMRLTPKQFYGSSKWLDFNSIDEACEVLEKYCKTIDYISEEKEKIAINARKMMR